MSARLIALIAAAVLALSACAGSDSATGDGGGPADRPAAPAPAENPAGDPAPGDTGNDAAGTPTGRTLATVDGGTVDLADYAETDHVLWFWAPW